MALTAVEYVFNGRVADCGRVPHSYNHWLMKPRKPPPPPHLGSYMRALLVSQGRRHLFVTPLVKMKNNGEDVCSVEAAHVMKIMK